jgi:hypothetical protein
MKLKGTKHKEKRKYWTQDDIDFLLNNYQYQSLEDIGETLGGRSLKSVSWKLTTLGYSKLKRWSDEEVAYLKIHYSKTSKKELAKLLNTTPKGVQDKASGLGLCKPKKAIEIGQKFSYLTVLDNNHKSGKVLCKCECGNETTIIAAALNNKNTKSCGCLVHKLKNNIKAPGETSFRHLYTRCKNGADKRSIPFLLTFEQFKDLVKHNCFYCGELPRQFNIYISNTGIQKHFGVLPETMERAWVRASTVDRTDSKLPYVVENCVPCCLSCNYSKNDKTVEEFIIHSQKIVDFQKKKAGGDGTVS